jgi:hypothetical protein
MYLNFKIQIFVRNGGQNNRRSIERESNEFFGR